MISKLRVITRFGGGPRVATLALGLSFITLAGGCSSSSSSGGNTMNGAVGDYNAQHYGDAHNEAAAVMAKSTGQEREKAAYVAGLSAYQAGNFEWAEKELIVASASSDAQTSGSAKAMLGQLRLDQHRPREAATYFADASRLLQGEDARQAAWHAGLAYREAGDETSAKRWLDTASGSQFDAPPPTAVASSANSSRNSSTLASPPSNAARTSNTTTANSKPVGKGETTIGFTLQVGAFNDKKRAKEAAEDAETLAKKESLGRVRIIPRTDARGQPMYLVQVGWWVTRTEASTARTKIGRLEYIVAPAPA